MKVPCEGCGKLTEMDSPFMSLCDKCIKQWEDDHK